MSQSPTFDDAHEPTTVGVASSTGHEPTTVGIAMCTFNGERFLRAQLDSIARQTRLPEQVAIFDDQSTDGTWALLQAWQAEMSASGSIHVSLHRNERRRGVVANFEAATLALATDLVFLCDQDDVWLPGKVALIEAAFRADPRRDFVFTDADLVDAQGDSLGATLFESLRISTDDSARIGCDDAFAMLCRRSLVTGATAAFRRAALQGAYPFPAQWMHDEWLAIMTAAGPGRLHCLREPTILYRQHGGNVVGAQRATLFTEIRRVWWRMNAPPARGFSDNVRERCEVLSARLVALKRDPRWIAIAARMLAFADFRSHLPASRPARVMSVVRHVAQYRRFTDRFEEFARDLANR